MLSENMGGSPKTGPKPDLRAVLQKRALRKSKRLARVQENAALGARTVRRGKKKKSPSLSKLKAILWDATRKVVYAESDICLTCGSDAPPVACHIIPSSSGALVKFFLPAIYRGCASCNKAESVRRGQWVKKFEARFGVDFVNALYQMVDDEMLKPINERFQIKKWWVLEQTARMRKLLDTTEKEN